MQSSYRAPPTVYQFQALQYKNPLRITKLHRQTTKQIYIPEATLPVQILEVINRCLLPNKEVMILLNLDSRRSLPTILPRSLKAEKCCTSDWLRLDISTQWGQNKWILVQCSTGLIKGVHITPTMLDIILKIALTLSIRFKI